MTQAVQDKERATARERAAFLRGAVAALSEGRHAAAESLARHAVIEDTADIEALLLLGLAVAARGRAAEAAPLLLRVAEARPDYAHPCQELARLPGVPMALAAAQFRACRALAPNDAKLAYAYADFLLDGGNPAAAAAVLRALMQTADGFAPARNLFGMALLELGDMPGAIAAFGAAIALDPTQAAPHANLGLALKIEGRFAEALRAYDSARALAPCNAAIRLNRAVALLRAGRFAEAWPDYEARLALAGARWPARGLLPRLDEQTPLAGRTVLAWHEEGFGDTLHFARYLPLLAARGATVLALVPAELERLFHSLPGVARVLSDPRAVPPFDWHVPFFSLPRAFATTLETIPAGAAYLRADPALVQRWRACLPRATRGGLRVGLCWAGQARPWLPGFVGLDRRRSLRLSALAPLAGLRGATFVSLQLGPPAAEAAHPPAGLALHDPTAAVRDFADTAAIIANLDVVVSVDTAVAHLAGALGTPVLLLDRYDSCWRWLSGREDSPWYPSLRILRQPAMGDWAPPIQRCVAALQAMAESRRAGAAG